MDKTCRVSQDELNHDLDQMKREKAARTPEQIAQSFIDDGRVDNDIVLEAIADLPQTAMIHLRGSIMSNDACEVGRVIQAAVYNYVLGMAEKGLIDD